MLKHDVQTVREDEHTFTLDEAEIAGMVRGVAMRALKVKDEDPNVIVGTPNIQVISGSVAAVLKVVIKQADPAPAVDAKDETEAKPADAEPPAPVPEAPVEQPAPAPAAADPEPAPAPEPATPAASAPAPAIPPAAVPGFVPGFSKTA